MKIIFACKSYEKRIDIDNFKIGCAGKDRIIDCQDCNIRADSMAELVKKLNNQFGITIDSLWVGALADGRIGFNRLENDDGYEPSDSEMKQWKAGSLQLWFADYDFTIEKQIIAPVELVDFAGVETHDY